MPPLRWFLRPVALAILIGIPALLLGGWAQAIAVGLVAAVGREVDARLRRANITFAQGFLPFRDPSDWPRGVQEEDGISWRWAALSGAQRARWP